MIKITNSFKETIELGKKFSSFLKEKDVVILEGMLGAGKTTFLKGVLKGLGKRNIVVSPSFVLLREYKTKKFFIYHIDLYRLDKKEIFSWGIEDYLYTEGGITFIEWGKKVQEFLPSYIKIEFFFLAENKRKIAFSFKNHHLIKDEFFRN
jgi:tRNA threonylcarbamoyladenosine biosynthesis protein TsaE